MQLINKEGIIAFPKDERKDILVNFLGLHSLRNILGYCYVLLLI